MTIDIKSKEILSNLKSTDPEFILETIDKIRESGNHFILAGVIDLLHETDLPEVKKSVLNLLSELKNKFPIIVRQIESRFWWNDHWENHRLQHFMLIGQGKIIPVRHIKWPFD